MIEQCEIGYEYIQRQKTYFHLYFNGKYRLIMEHIIKH